MIEIARTEANSVDFTYYSSSDKLKFVVANLVRSRVRVHRTKRRGGLVQP